MASQSAPSTASAPSTVYAYDSDMWEQSVFELSDPYRKMHLDATATKAKAPSTASATVSGWQVEPVTYTARPTRDCFHLPGGGATNGAPGTAVFPMPLEPSAPQKVVAPKVAAREMDAVSAAMRAAWLGDGDGDEEFVDGGEEGGGGGGVADDEPLCEGADGAKAKKEAAAKKKQKKKKQKKKAAKNAAAAAAAVAAAATADVTLRVCATTGCAVAVPAPIVAGNTVRIRGLPADWCSTVTMPGDLNGTTGTVSAGPDGDGLYTVQCSCDGQARVLPREHIELSALLQGLQDRTMDVEQLEAATARVLSLTIEVQECQLRHEKQEAKLRRIEETGSSARTTAGGRIAWRMRKAACVLMQKEVDRISEILRECPEAGYSRNAMSLQEQLRDAVLHEQQVVVADEGGAGVTPVPAFGSSVPTGPGKQVIGCRLILPDKTEAAAALAAMNTAERRRGAARQS